MNHADIGELDYNIDLWLWVVLCQYSTTGTSCLCLVMFFVHITKAGTIKMINIPMSWIFLFTESIENVMNLYYLNSEIGMLKTNK
jgi:hypothetical protein